MFAISIGVSQWVSDSKNFAVQPVGLLKKPVAVCRTGWQKKCHNCKKKNLFIPFTGDFTMLYTLKRTIKTADNKHLHNFTRKNDSQNSTESITKNKIHSTALF
jgi:hypothetical protein